MKKFKLGGIRIENGCAAYAAGRTAASVTGLSPETEVQLVETVSRWTGTGYYNSIYRVVGTDDAIIIRHNDGPPSNIEWDNVVVEVGYFAARRSYGAACRKASKQFKLPMEVCLAVGPELAEEVAEEAAKVEYYPGKCFIGNRSNPAKVEPYHLNDGAINELYAGIDRRKQALLSLLAHCSEDLRIKISKSGQKYSGHIASYFAELRN